MSVTLPDPGRLHAALQACHPAGLPEWLTAASPRCGTSAPPLRLDADQAEELADLAALVLWECQQAEGDTDPFTTTFAAACEQALTFLHPVRS
ncbi:hypothetical protein E5083_30160 [Streptomyces bauhiniae]|uniref:Uncharacterized protein n=1 Tax=Streptomyces bauhiniae TaxID=2340725 RepID=A0A4Z1CTK3_9ACTN|nr:hypothetical protein [Streptomyces bauhiniae]TGN72206.1 hypothetical protein E5083_30160 [Streptomyces bauhiniae]